MGAMEDRRWLVLTLVCLVLSVDLPIILFHAYVKVKIEKRVSADDLVIALADVSYSAYLHSCAMLMYLQLLWIGYIVCQVAACMNGFGAHAADLSKEFHYINSTPARNGDLIEALRVRLSQMHHTFAASIILFMLSARTFPSHPLTASHPVLVPNHPLPRPLQRRCPHLHWPGIRFSQSLPLAPAARNNQPRQPHPLLSRPASSLPSSHSPSIRSFPPPPVSSSSSSCSSNALPSPPTGRATARLRMRPATRRSWRCRGTRSSA